MSALTLVVVSLLLAVLFAVFCVAVIKAYSLSRLLRFITAEKNRWADILTTMACPEKITDLPDGSYKQGPFFGLNSYGERVYAFIEEKSEKYIIVVIEKGDGLRTSFVIEGGRLVDWGGLIPLY